MAGSQTEIVANQIEDQRKGFMGLSLTNYDADTEPQIAAGSTVEISGAIFAFASAESITGWGSIGTSNDVYVKLVVSGTSVTAVFTTTPPTWSTSKSGWYDSLDRYVAKLYKDGSGNYTLKRLLGSVEDVIKGHRWILTSGTAASFVAPWTARYRVKLYGGGGGGAGVTTNIGAGGGGGGFVELCYDLSAGDALTYTVGAGGTAGALGGGTGGTGGTTTCTDGSRAATATGGVGGRYDSPFTGGAAGRGEAPQSEGNQDGEAGGNGDSTWSATTGNGGASAGASRALAPVPANQNGTAGVAYGGGGSGGTGPADVTGGAGGTGAIIIDAEDIEAV